MSDEKDPLCAAVKLEACVDGESAFTMVLDDPSGNSYIETPAESHEKDPLLQLDLYERTAEQAEGIGLLPPEPAGKLSLLHVCPLKCHCWNLSGTSQESSACSALNALLLREKVPFANRSL